MSMKTIHDVTVIRMHLVTVDEGGNLVRLRPRECVIDKFTAEEFARAFDLLAQARAQADAEGAETKPDA